MNENDKFNNDNPGEEEKEKISFSDDELGKRREYNGNPYSDPKYHSDWHGEEKRSSTRFEGYNPYSKYKSEEPEFCEDRSQTPSDDFREALDVNEAKSDFHYLGLGFALFTLISAVVSLVIQLVGMAMNKDALSNIWFINIISPVALYLFALPVLLVILSKVPARKAEGRPMRVKEWLGCFLICFGLMYIGSFISEYVVSFLSAMTGKDYTNALNDLIDFNDLSNLWVTALFTVVIAPIGEELVFRKLIIDRTRKYGAATSIIISALLFGLMHGNVFQLFYAFLLGLVLGYMYYTTGKVLPCMLMHAAVNFFGSIVVVLLTYGIDLEAIESGDMIAVLELVSKHWIQLALLAVFTLFIYACMVCAIVIPIANRKKIVLDKGESPIPRGLLKKVVIFNGGMIVLWVVFALQLAISLL